MQNVHESPTRPVNTHLFHYRGQKSNAIRNPKNFKIFPYITFYGVQGAKFNEREREEGGGEGGRKILIEFNDRRVAS